MRSFLLLSAAAVIHANPIPQLPLVNGFGPNQNFDAIPYGYGPADIAQSRTLFGLPPLDPYSALAGLLLSSYLLDGNNQRTKRSAADDGQPKSYTYVANGQTHHVKYKKGPGGFSYQFHTVPVGAAAASPVPGAAAASPVPGAAAASPVPGPTVLANAPANVAASPQPAPPVPSHVLPQQIHTGAHHVNTAPPAEFIAHIKAIQEQLQQLSQFFNFG